MFAHNGLEIRFYSGTPDMGSLYDAVIPTAAREFRSFGVIDGSGLEAYVMADKGGLYIYWQDTAVPHWGFGKRALPHPLGFRCAKASEAPLPVPRLEGGPSLSRSGGEGAFVPAFEALGRSALRSDP